MVDGDRERTTAPGRPASRRRSRVSSLCRAATAAGWRMPRQAEPLGDARADHGRAIADDEQAVERTHRGRLENRRDRGVLVVKPDRNRLVLPRILDQMTAIGREDELHPKPRGGIAKRARLVSGRRR